MKYYGLILAFAIFLLQSCTGSSNYKAEQEATLDTIAVEEPAEESAASDSWEIQYFVDDFGEETKEGFILNVCQGEFSNSATTDSPLIVRIIVTPDDIRFDMYEYGSHYMKGEETLEFRAKLPDDSEVKFKTYNYDNGPNSVVKADMAKVKELFEKYPKLRFAARTLSPYSTSTYRFVYEGNPEVFKTKLEELSAK